MRFFYFLLSIILIRCTAVVGQTEAPPQALNHYITFLDKSSEVVTDRFKMLSNYKAAVNQFRERPGLSPSLPSSGPLEEYYYKKAIATKALSNTEKERLNAAAKTIWELLTALDITCKQLETHVHLKLFEEDNFTKSDQLTAQIQALINQYSVKKVEFYQEIRQIYRQHQPFRAEDPFLKTEKAMEEVLLRQKNLLDSLPYYIDAKNPSDWPVEIVRRSMLEDEQFLATIGNTKTQLPYPASDALASFQSALLSIQSAKRNAIDGYTFASRQSSEYGNEAYLNLINYFNNDLLAFYQSFVTYSQTNRRLLYFPAFSPVFGYAIGKKIENNFAQTPPFQDKPLISFPTKKATAPASPALTRTLNEYVDFINESLRQMHLLQLTLRNYQSSAAYYRDPERARSRPGLTYSHEKFEIPSSAYSLLINASNSVLEPYRKSINSQSEVLMNILKEMDQLSIELIAYTQGKQYLNDQMERSDAILDRNLALFETFDQKKEQLYNDLRRIHESYPPANPANSWIVAGNALQKVMDGDRDVLFGIKSFLRGETPQLPETGKVSADAQQLIANEYKNLEGLKRYGRSNGLCPYSPYEDLAGNTARFVAMSQKLNAASSNTTRHPFESFYYIYNNELVYEYNKFVELAKGGLLKAVNQPDLFIFEKKQANPAAVQDIQIKTDTRFVEPQHLDSVFAERIISNANVTRSLDGFAANNMVLLLDVSSSMNSPFKMPLLKRSIKSMLTLLRNEDQISIVLYSGKARVILKPTSGSKAAEIARIIDLLQSDGDTDGNEGLRLAYKTASKHYIKSGNNRIILATDGEFPVSEEVIRMIAANANLDLYLTILTFGRNVHTGQKLKKLSQLGKGTYAHVTEESADLQLILEAQGKKIVKK